MSDITVTLPKEKFDEMDDFINNINAGKVQYITVHSGYAFSVPYKSWIAPAEAKIEIEKHLKECNDALQSENVSLRKDYHVQLDEMYKLQTKLNNLLKEKSTYRKSWIKRLFNKK